MKSEKIKSLSGQITIFLALCAGLMITVILAEIEAARHISIITAQKTSAMTACRSMLAEYNIPLFEMYSIFGIDGNGRDLSQDMKKKVTDNAGSGIFCADIGEVCMTDLCGLTDENLAPLKKEIIQYMKTAGYLDIAQNLFSDGTEKKINNVQSDKEKISQKLVQDEKQAAKDKIAYEEADTGQSWKNQDQLQQGENAAGQNEEENVKDPRKTLTSLLENGLLSIVLPVDFYISDAALERNEGFEKYSSKNLDFTSVSSVTNKMDAIQFNIPNVLGEKSEDAMIYLYLKDKFKSALKYEHVAHDTKLEYEMEYLLCGHQNDRTNLLDTANRIAMFRTIFNFTYLVTDGTKTAAVHSLAASIAASILMPWLEPVIYSLILAAWAYGEALMDLRVLYRGGKIPLLKNSSNWQLSLSGLSALTVNTAADDDMSGDEQGLSYDDYLMVLLFFLRQQKKLERMADLVEENIGLQAGYENFSIKDCFYSIGCIFEYHICPLFSGFNGYLYNETKISQWSECY